MMKLIRNIIRMWEKDNIQKAGEASLKKYGKLYKKLEQYDKGELSEKDIMDNSQELRKIIQSS